MLGHHGLARSTPYDYVRAALTKFGTTEPYKDLPQLSESRTMILPY